MRGASSGQHHRELGLAGADSQTGVDSFGRRRDGAMDDGFGIGFGLPAIGDHENL